MNAVWIIFKKEAKVFFLQPAFYIICFLLSVIFSWTYPLQLSAFGQTLMNFVMQQGIPPQQLNIHYGVFLRQLSYLNLLMIFVVPALTMRLFSEEKKMRTMDLLMTSPVSSVQIVLGKFFSALIAVLAVVVLALAYPLATVPLVDNVQWAPLLIAFGGIFLVGAVYAAMDLFCSSLTEHSLVAYVMSVIFNVSVWFIGMGAEAVDSETARKIFEHLSLNSHLAGMVEGTVRTSALVFFLSAVGLFVFLTERVVESARWRSA